VTGKMRFLGEEVRSGKQQGEQDTEAFNFHEEQKYYNDLILNMKDRFF
jgi:hypothetical protein